MSITFFKKQNSDLLPEEIKTGEAGEVVINSVLLLPTAQIRPNAHQPRMVFDDYELSQLAVSIQQNGLLQPICVRKMDTDSYELISGERRLRAAKLINMDQIPCIVIDATDENSAVLAILENIQRADLNFIEEAYSIRTLIERFGITQEDCAAKLGIAQSTVANKLRLLRLSDEEKGLVLQYRLSERQARALLKLPTDLRRTAIEKISREGLNTAQTEKLIEDMLARKQEKPAKEKKRTFIFRQTGLYINSFNKTIDEMKKAGIACTAEQTKTEEYIEYLVRIPLR